MKDLTVENIIDIFTKNQTEFKGSNEAELHSAEDILKLIEYVKIKAQIEILQSIQLPLDNSVAENSYISIERLFQLLKESEDKKT